MCEQDSMIPRGKMSPYAFFVKSSHEDYQKNNVEFKIEEFARDCSDKWKVMTNEEKKYFESIAEKESEKINNESKNYVMKDFETKPTYPIDPNVPKKPLSDFYWFCQDERPKIKIEKPEATVEEIAKEMGERWYSCPAEKKLKYENLEKKDKERYKKELEIFNKNTK